MTPVHEEVLAAVRALAGPHTNWDFRIQDVVRALPHLNAGTVRTHVASRCCVNAPSHHQSRHPYFRSVKRGTYRLEPRFRPRPTRTRKEPLPWPDNWFAERGTGVDETQIVENLKLTPTERLERMRYAVLSLEELLRSAGRP